LCRCALWPADLPVLAAYREVLGDIRAFWPLVRPGGILFGDDYEILWPGVIRAEPRASTPNGSVPNKKWFVQKPLAV
jgi:hypothetical protein